MEVSRKRRIVLSVLFTLCAVSLAASAQDAGEPGFALNMNPAVIAPDLPFADARPADFDAYGGWTGIQGERTGFFHVEKIGDRWWFITPEGNVFFMLKVINAKEKAVPRLKSWGFNTGERGSGLPYDVHLDLLRLASRPYPVAQRPGFPPWVSLPDVFDPEWPEQCARRAEEVLGPIKDDPLLIGYFLVNEICLDGWYEAATHTELDAPARAAFVEVARTYYADKPAELTEDWKDYQVTSVDDLKTVQGDPPSIPELKAIWVATMAERAFGVASNAARAVDPNHLNLGTRMFNAPLPEPGILAAMGKYCDAISMNLYSMFPDRLPVQMFTLVPAIHAITGRPTMTTEFSFRAADTLHPGTMGALPAVDTQAQRAIGYLSYVSAAASIPSHIGVAWYTYHDDDIEKPWGGYAEDCNFGVVDNDQRPYAVLSEAMRTTNNVAYELAADPVRNESIPLFWRTELTRWDVPQDEMLLGRLARAGKPFEDPLARTLPEPRRYHENYWVQHRGPRLTVNDDRFVGWCGANMIESSEDSTTLTLIDVLSYTSFPRSLWLGTGCPNPDEPIALETNARFLQRRMDVDGNVREMIVADCSYVRTDYDRTELRLNCRVPYLRLAYERDTQTLSMTIRGSAQRVGVAGVSGWKIVCNGTPVASAQVEEGDGLTVVALNP
ncbi:MAG: hypothetical protein KJ060_12305 [Candidatus Hydrogenedentes bacterium]|nr:hypothetical protein [Candidatus Hydrogenedentota bacterium]